MGPSPLCFCAMESRHPSGIIEHALDVWQDWRTGRRIRRTEVHYSSVIKAGVRNSLHGLLGASNENSTVHNASRLLDVVAPDFPPTGYQQLKQLEDHLDTAVRGAAMNVIADLRPVIDLNVRTIDGLQSEIVDSRNAANTTDELADLPDIESADEDHIRSLKLLKDRRAQRLRIWVAAATALVLSAVAVAAEGALVHGSLLPMFNGVPGIPEWMLALQALVITMGMVFVAHHSRLSSATNTDWRWISRATLFLIALALACLRAGILGVHEGSASVAPGAIESWGLLLLVFLAAVVLAVFGAAAYERAIRALRQADSAGNVVGLEAAVAAVENRRRGRVAFDQRRRAFHTRAVHRTRQLENEIHRKTRETQRLLRGEMQRALRSLTPVIRQAARCLARWRHAAEPSQDMAVLWQRPLLMPLIMIGLGLFGIGCGSEQQDIVERHLLLDTSGSMPADLRARIREHVIEEVRDWTETAVSGNRLRIWWLTAEGHPYPAHSISLTMPALQVPAHRHRQRIVEDFDRDVTAALNGLPTGVPRTRILETLFYIGSAVDGPWQITIYSDLQQDSPSWDRTRVQLTENPEADIVDQMLAICPRTATPPSEIAVRTWPGLTTSRHADIHEHHRYRRLFQLFFSQWAPDASVRVGAI